MLPQQRPAMGRPNKDHRLVLDGICWVLRTGALWRDVPRDRFGSWKTFSSRFYRWQEAGVWAGVLREVRRQLPGNGLHRFSPALALICGHVLAQIPDLSALVGLGPKGSKFIVDISIAACKRLAARKYMNASPKFDLRLTGNMMRQCADRPYSVGSS